MSPQELADGLAALIDAGAAPEVTDAAYFADVGLAPFVVGQTVIRGNTVVDTTPEGGGRIVAPRGKLKALLAECFSSAPLSMFEARFHRDAPEAPFEVTWRVLTLAVAKALQDDGAPIIARMRVAARALDPDAPSITVRLVAQQARDEQRVVVHAQRGEPVSSALPPAVEVEVQALQALYLGRGRAITRAVLTFCADPADDDPEIRSTGFVPP